MTMPAKVNKVSDPPYKTAGVVFLVLALVIFVLVYLQFRGDFTPKVKLTMFSERAGLVMDPGSKVTYNGVQIGRVDSISEVTRDGKPAAKFVLNVNPKYLSLVPENVNAQIKATTVFGGKYVSLTTPRDDRGNVISKGHLTPKSVINAVGVTTEINTLFQTITSIAEKVDPVKLNLTLSAAAQALTGLGDRFGQSIVNANAILDDVNPRMPQARHDIQQLAALGDVYANASPDLFDFLDNSVPTARTINQHQRELDAALLAAVGFGNTGADVFGRGGPYLARGAADLVPSAQLLDTYSPELFCTLRNYHDIEPKAATFLGGNGYSLATHSELLSGLGLMLNPTSLVPLLLSQIGGLAAGVVGGAPNPYMYPENLPRVNAHGGPGGAPGCWQQITHDFWPAPELVMDTANSIAPYNHLETGSPYAIEYVWGRQVGDNTINP
ncbi:MCE family protein [Mycobacterium kansasii]|uniref:Cell invasion protein n=3 Tax=Mycobacterium kansasii TaxID=1768 RepID=A0A1V3WBY6_MYCKA|nr:MULTISPECIES: MCE family protein [Mycobacterium]EUA05575.1 mce related family protein [Mycobacterium kansasii 824]AGZ51651.1 MCE-family protein MCE1A [Mycobacterium kansasii ATCC 12478]ARG56613.1 MCE-family protein MCE1A [Mycobacterium kansasii]ARG62133.1 MCE-family protein MCE1A [Mycobacterium kansasii]ARG69756.1 MCE-family protein MCE1A [Mycobacterium kansasii]